MSETLLRARPYWISYDAPVANEPEDALAFLDVYLVTGLFGGLVIETMPDVEPPTDCQRCGFGETIAVRVGREVDVDGRDEWYCPSCGAIESEIPLRTTTRWRDQPKHWALTGAMMLVWIAVAVGLGFLVGAVEMTNRIDAWLERRSDSDV
jgi:hypothetical protein